MTDMTTTSNGPSGPAKSKATNRNTARCFLIGAAKAGTTSLADYLDQHPDVFVCKPKEPNFFAYPEGVTPRCHGPVDESRLYELLLKYSVTDPTQYRRLFAEASPTQQCVDASVRYLYCEDAPNRIYSQCPDARLVAILRQPVDRLNSHYHMNVRMGIEPASLSAALQDEPRRIQAGWGWDWHYVRVGQYAPQIRRYLDCFGSQQVLVLFYDEFVRDAVGTTQRVFAHLGVDPAFVPDTTLRSNVGKTPRWRWLRQLVWGDSLAKRVAQTVVPTGVRRQFSSWIESKNRQDVPKLSYRTQSELMRQFADDAAELSTLLGRSVPW